MSIIIYRDLQKNGEKKLRTANYTHKNSHKNKIKSTRIYSLNIRIPYKSVRIRKK